MNIIIKIYSLIPKQKKKDDFQTKKKLMNEFVKFLAKMILMHVHLMIGYKKEE
jgi:hypothetical protein